MGKKVAWDVDDLRTLLVDYDDGKPVFVVQDGVSYPVLIVEAEGRVFLLPAK